MSKYVKWHLTQNQDRVLIERVTDVIQHPVESRSFVMFDDRKLFVEVSNVNLFPCAADALQHALFQQRLNDLDI